MGKDVIGSLEGLPGQAADVGKGRSGRYQAISLSNTFHKRRWCPILNLSALHKVCNFDLFSTLFSGQARIYRGSLSRGLLS